LHRSHILEELGEERCEQGRTSEADLRQSLAVGLNNSINSDNFRVRRVSIHGKAVAHAINAKMSRNAAETENGKASVRVVRFHDCTNVQKAVLVLVITAQEMERASIRWVTIGGCVVNGSY